MLSFSDDQTRHEEILVFTKRWSALENAAPHSRQITKFRILADDTQIAEPINVMLQEVHALCDKKGSAKWGDIIDIFDKSNIFNVFYLSMLEISGGDVQKALQQLLAVAGFEKDLTCI